MRLIELMTGRADMSEGIRITGKGLMKLFTGYLITFLIAPCLIVITAAAAAAAPVLYADWLKERAEVWFADLFDHSDERAAEWYTNVYMDFEDYSPADYSAYWLAEAVSLYHYVDTGQNICTKDLSMDEYMNSFNPAAGSNQFGAIMDELQERTGYSVDLYGRSRIKDIAADMQQKGNDFSSNGSGATGLIVLPSDGSVIRNALAWAVAIANDPDHGYSQINRYGPDYDCSSFVSAAFHAAGVPVGLTNNTTSMQYNFPANGFTMIPFSKASLAAGDVMLAVNHTEIYLGNDMSVGAHIDENGTTFGRQSGDQTGNEISVGKYWDDGWVWILRYTG